ncbi:MAG: DUF6768 family protein [Pseudomonadota bacterium]
MDDFDKALESALRADPIDERGYYREAFASLKGEGSGLRIAAWIATMIFAAGLIYCLIKMMFHTNDTQTLIKYGVWVVILNQAQIAMKLWFNMQLNRRAVTREIHRVVAMIDRR